MHGQLTPHNIDHRRWQSGRKILWKSSGYFWRRYVSCNRRNETRKQISIAAVTIISVQWEREQLKRGIVVCWPTRLSLRGVCQFVGNWGCHLSRRIEMRDKGEGVRCKAA